MRSAIWRWSMIRKIEGTSHGAMSALLLNQHVTSQKAKIGYHVTVIIIGSNVPSELKKSISSNSRYQMKPNPLPKTQVIPTVFSSYLSLPKRPTIIIQETLKTTPPLPHFPAPPTNLQASPSALFNPSPTLPATALTPPQTPSSSPPPPIIPPAALSLAAASSSAARCAAVPSAAYGFCT